MGASSSTSRPVARFRRLHQAMLIGVAGVFLMASARAGVHPGGPTITPSQARQIAPFVNLGAIDSRPGETLDQFILGVGLVLQEFTQATGHEACGVLMVKQGDLPRTSGPWRVRVTTNRSHIACVMVQYQDSGYRRLGPGIHSHPHLPSGFNINPQDERWRRPRCDLEQEQCRARVEAAPRCGDDWRVFDNKFSAKDFNHGPGYLVSRGRVLYQHGEQYPIRMVGEVGGADRPDLEFQGEAVERARMSAAAAAAWQGGEADPIPAVSCDGPGVRRSGA